MAHEFDSGFFYNVHGNREWHGLGKVIEYAPKTFREAMELGGMDWKVIEVPFGPNLEFLTEEQKADNNLRQWMKTVLLPKHGNRYPVASGWKMLYREDSGDLLHVCRSTWKVVQNVDAFAWFEPYLMEKDMEMSAGVSLMGGRRIAITCRLNHPKEVVPGDEVYPYFLLANSHDGSIAVTMRLTGIRTVCNNTLEMNLEGLRGNFTGSMDVQSTSVRIKHSRKVRENMDRVRDFFDIQKQRFETNVELWQQMAKKEITAAEFKAYANKVYARQLKRQPKPSSVLDSDLLEPKDISETARWESLVRNFESGRGSEFAPGTVWSALNAITEFTSHYAESDDIESARRKLDSLYLGENARINGSAVKYAAELVGA